MNNYQLHYEHLGGNSMAIRHPDGMVSVMMLDGLNVYTFNPSGISKSLLEHEVDG